MSRASRRAAAGLAIGAVVADRYRVEAKLGEGGMAEVFRAEDLTTSRRVAIKVLHADIAGNPEAVERTKREGQMLSALDHPAIVSVETFGQLADGTVYLVMELLEGETLGARMRRGPLDAAELAPIVVGTCVGLHAAHSRGIVHRDLKPDNVFLCHTEHGLQVKLLDFGISKFYGGERLTQTGEVLGTPRYMSPEQLGAEPDVDARVDGYALGVILYEALAGKPPFLATTPTDLIIAILHGRVAPLCAACPEVPLAVEAVVMRALSKVREARFDTAMQLAEAYIDAVGGASAVRAQQRRGMATRAFGGVLAPLVVEPSSGIVPQTRPPPPGASDRHEVAGNLRLGTFSGLEIPPFDPREIVLEPTNPSMPTTAMGAVPGVRVPAPPGAAAPHEPVEEALPEAAPRVIPPTASPELAAAAARVPATRETPIGLADAALASSEPSRRVAATAMMDASHLELVSSGSAPPAVESGADTPSTASAPSPAGRGTAHRRSASGRAAAARAGRGERVKKAFLVLGALVAGALSAGAVIAAMHFYERQNADPPPSTHGPSRQPSPEGNDPRGELDGPSSGTSVAVLPVADAADAAAVEAPARADEDADAGDGDAREADGDDVEASRGAEARQARRERLRAAARERAEASPTGASRTGASSSPLEAARQALRRGDPTRCIGILNDAIGSGASSFALRRRGDCNEAAGRRAEAIRDYQRFCRLAPDHPAVTEVRPLLESWGRTCP